MAEVALHISAPLAHLLDCLGPVHAKGSARIATFVRTTRPHFVASEKIRIFPLERQQQFARGMVARQPALATRTTSELACRVSFCKSLADEKASHESCGER